MFLHNWTTSRSDAPTWYQSPFHSQFLGWNSDLMEIEFSSYTNYEEVITATFCTCYAVVACVKICCDLMTTDWIATKSHVSWIWNLGEKSWMEWSPGWWVPNGTLCEVCMCKNICHTRVHCHAFACWGIHTSVFGVLLLLFFINTLRPKQNCQYFADNITKFKFHWSLLWSSWHWMKWK